MKMHKRLLYRYIIAALSCLLFFSLQSKAQFREEAFKQNYNEHADSTAKADTANQFTFKKYFGGLAHKNKLDISTVFISSMILPGTAQIYNGDYWKLPIIYGGIGALAGTGGYYLNKFDKSSNKSDKTTATWLFAGAGLVYWGSLMDGAACYESEVSPDPGRATLYSILLPGLGQIYNGELFKVPIYWGMLIGGVHFWSTNQRNYLRFKWIHNQATMEGIPDSERPPISGETAKWYRNVYRRYRDYSVVATIAFYMLQIIDANVFAYMHDFQVDDNISMNIEPTLIAPDNAYALNYTGGNNAVGLKFGIRF